MIDLHTHSSRSDGTDEPAELVKKAAAAGLTVVALTDHDTTAGWAEAVEAADAVGITLVRGIEVSVEDGGRGHHLLAYEPAPDDPALLAMLERSIEARDERIPAMVEKIRAYVPELRLDDVAAIAAGSVLGRPHLADALVRLGAAEDRGAAFRQYLEPGCPTYVETWSPPLEDAIRVLTAAGGAAVLAHPSARSSSVSRERFAELAQVGLAGIEVDHQEHDGQARRRLRQIAQDLGLIVTGSSDHHGTRKDNHELGCNTTAPEELGRLLDLIGERGRPLTPSPR